MALASEQLTRKEAFVIPSGRRKMDTGGQCGLVMYANLCNNCDYYICHGKSVLRRTWFRIEQKV